MLPLRARWPHLTEETIRAVQPQAGGRARGRDGARAGRHRARRSSCRRPRAAAARPSSCCPGPPRELQPMWRDGDRRPTPFAHAIRGATVYEQRMLRLFGLPESEIATTLRAAEARRRGARPDRGHDLRARRRARDRHPLRAARRARSTTRSSAIVRERHADALFSDDGSDVDEQVAAMLVAQGLTVAVAESCTGGLVLARLTDRPGPRRSCAAASSSTPTTSRTELAGVPAELIEAPRRRLRGGRRRRSRTARASASAPTSGSASPASPGPTAARPRSPSDSSGSRCRAPTGGGSCAAPTSAAAAPTCASARRPRRCTCCGACCWAPPTRRPRERRDAAVRRRRASASAVRDAARALGARRGRARRARAPAADRESLHLTLCFLGEQPPSAVAEIAAALASDGAEPSPPSRSCASARRPGCRRGVRACSRSGSATLWRAARAAATALVGELAAPSAGSRRPRALPPAHHRRAHARPAASAPASCLRRRRCSFAPAGGDAVSLRRSTRGGARYDALASRRRVAGRRRRRVPSATSRTGGLPDPSATGA